MRHIHIIIMRTLHTKIQEFLDNNIRFYQEVFKI